MVIVVGLILAFVLIAIFANRETRSCRWREYRQSEGESLWRCVQCGAATEGQSGKPPQICLKSDD
ncbi:hypothetical protein [Roseivivax sp.]